MGQNSSLYSEDLAYIHAAGFGELARGAAPDIARRLRAARIQIHRVLDLGCGAGVLTALLVEAGFEVTGIDISSNLLALARAAVPQACFVNASIYDIELPPCEAILAIGEPLSYHENHADADDRVRAFLRRTADALPSGGILIFDVIETGQPSLAGRSWCSGDDWAALVETAEDAPSRNLVRKIETFRRMDQLYRRGGEVHCVRVFDSRQLLTALGEFGFVTETSQSYGGYGLAPRRRAFFCTRS